MSRIEQIELEGHRGEILSDMRKLFEKYRAIFDWDIPEVDQKAADKLILVEMHNALEKIEEQSVAD